MLQPDSAKVYELIQALEDNSLRVRIKAADDLGKLGALAKQGVPALTKALEHENGMVRAIVADALGRIGEAYDVGPKLLEVMRKGEHYSSGHAAVALARLGASGVPALLEATTYKGDWVASDARKCIG